MDEAIKPTDAIYDCNVFLQGLIRQRGPAIACLDEFEKGAVRLFVSDELLVEIRDVLTRPKLQKKFVLLTQQRVEKLLQDLLYKAVFVKEVPLLFRYERDPKDEPYINLALAVGVPYIVSRDKDLLDLMDESKVDGKAFRTAFPNLSILDPVDFLRILPFSPPTKQTEE